MWYYSGVGNTGQSQKRGGREAHSGRSSWSNEARYLNVQSNDIMEMIVQLLIQFRDGKTAQCHCTSRASKFDQERVGGRMQQRSSKGM